MFLRWKRRTLSDRAQHHRNDVCPHGEAGGEGARLVWSPIVLHSVWGPGSSPKHRTIWTPAGSIRDCCRHETTAPTARVAWWQDAWLRRARPATAPGSEATTLLRGCHDWLEGELRAKVAQPSQEELDIYEAFDGYPYTKVSGESVYGREVRRWREATARWQAYLAGRMRGEPFEWWAVRTGNAKPGHRKPNPGPAPRSSGGRPSATPPASNGASLAVSLATLGLAFPTTPGAVRAAYLRLAFETHPDRGGHAAAFVAATLARDTVLSALDLLGASA